MTTKVLTGVYTAGYTLSAAYSALAVTGPAAVGGKDGARGGIGHVTGGDAGTGLTVDFAARVNNRGDIYGGTGGDGVHDGAAVGAGGAGGAGAVLAAGVALTNHGRIDGGAGGAGGFGGGAGGAGGAGVVLAGAGGVTNIGTIFGGYGGFGGNGPHRQGVGGAGGAGLVLAAGGTVSNSGRIEGGAGAHSGYHEYQGGAAGSAGGAGVSLAAGGAVTNGGLIKGGAGGYGGAGGGVTGTGGAGVDLAAGGQVVNLAGATITGGAGALGPVSGTGGAGGAGVVLAAGGLVRNGGTIRGGAAGKAGFGGLFGVSGDGVVVAGAGTVVNGAANSGGTGRIEGEVGVYAGAGSAARVVNFGVIDGLGGTAVEFRSAADTLVVEGRTTFVGAVKGGGGTLVLARGTGRLVQPFVGGNVTVARRTGSTTFYDFATLEIGVLARFATAASVRLTAGQSLIDSGALTIQLAGRTAVNAGLIEATGGKARFTIRGALDNTGTLAADGGTLAVTGALTGAGAVTIDGGTLELAAATAARIAFTGTGGVLALGDAQGFTGQVAGLGKTGGKALDLTDIGFVDAGEASFAGTRYGGTLTVTDGTHIARIRLVGDFLGATFTCAGDGAGGTRVTAAQSPPVVLPFLHAMARMGAAPSGSFHASEDRAGAPPSLARPRVQAA